MGKLTRKTPLSKVFSYSLTLRKYIGLFLAGLLILSCSGYPVRGDRPRGVYHRVKSGETLSIIARVYRVDLQELAEINNIDNPDRIETDGVIFIPDAHQVVDDVMTAARPQPPPAAPGEDKGSATIPKAVSKPETRIREAVAQPEKRREASPAAVTVRDRPEPSGVSERDSAARKTSAKLEKEEIARASAKPEKEEIADQPVKPKENDGKADQIQFDKKRFIWPVRGKVVSHFGIQPNRMYYNGIRIAAGEGTAVQAAADGHVIFSAHLKDYGESIIIQHEGQYATVYTHLGIRTVRVESRIRKGDRIAFLGKADQQEEPYLHFEIRHKNKARNPLFFLP
ncbi:MAG: LysM peptidoglycan-binding domain-containing M23 family metallopeptidase [Deltaproteobacteria bacterium]|nr:LysM peptidoglycan-binding domain-containing M23 family metallopeptidase [Deltaproteobacteria bacterium]